jgi:hypothetical protein
MKINFEKFVISEASKISKDLHLKEEKQKLHECGCGCGCCSKSNEPEFMQIEFEMVDPKEFSEEAQEAKTLSEELSRMKQILSFNNPLLKS